jgi:hypothetical protein
MAILSFRAFFFCCLVWSPNTLSPSSLPPGVGIAIEGLKRISTDEVHLTVKITNNLDHSIFLAGNNYDFLSVLPHETAERRPGPSPELVFIEHRRVTEDWKTITCLENPPPNVIKLNPNQAITHVIWWNIPMRGVCKNFINRWEGQFRFRLEYFDSEKQARAYVRNFYSATREEVHRELAFSEPIEIPPVASP